MKKGERFVDYTKKSMGLKSIITSFYFLLIVFDSSGQTLFSGEFEADGYFTTFEGTWKVVKTDLSNTLVFEDDFKAKKAPDLKVFLSKLSYDDIDEDNADDSTTSIFIALLEKFKGRMEFVIPKDVDLSNYKSIVVHCVEYTVLWGGADLK